MLHLVRHGEVDNPDGVLYGRLPGFGLSVHGRATAAAAAAALKASGRTVTRIIASPLERAQESAEPFAATFGLDFGLDERLIEASSRLEGGRYAMDLSILAKPSAWRHLVNPFRPSWGEPFVEVSGRMLELLHELDDDETGDTVLVSHQLPIWLVHRHAAGQPAFHDPRRRRCALSSITSFEWRDRGLVETCYRDPGASLLRASVDRGAV